jgi:hypothetical protein
MLYCSGKSVFSMIDNNRGVLDSEKEKSKRKGKK